jgi:hypothetical protein
MAQKKPSKFYTKKNPTNDRDEYLMSHQNRGIINPKIFKNHFFIIIKIFHFDPQVFCIIFYQFLVGGVFDWEWIERLFCTFFLSTNGFRQRSFLLNKTKKICCVTINNSKQTTSSALHKIFMIYAKKRDHCWIIVSLISIEFFMIF